jgi:hypothetical protein
VSVRVLVTGGRDYDSRDTVFAVLDAIHREREVCYLITGAAKGADSLAAEWGGTNGIPAAHVRAEWEKYGPRAGPMRNEVMLTQYRPDLVVAFPGGRGTADMVRRANRDGVPVHVVLPPE